MKNYCKNICYIYKASKDRFSSDYYSNGYKRCNECELFIEYDKNRCPCCNNILRIRPHNTISKKRMLKNLIYN